MRPSKKLYIELPHKYFRKLVRIKNLTGISICSQIIDAVGFYLEKNRMKGGNDKNE